MKTKPAQSKVLLAADRERKEIVSALAEQVRRMRKLSRRLNAAARNATHFEGVNGKRYTVEEWLADGLKEVVGKVGDCGLAEDVAFLRGYSTAQIERDIVAYIRRELEDEVREEKERAEAVERARAATDELAETEGALDALKALQGMRGDGSPANARELLAAIDALPTGIRGPLESIMGAAIQKLREAVTAREQLPVT